MLSQKEKLMRRIQAEDFAVYETVLYLDGHPENKKALAFYEKHLALLEALKNEYNQNFGPLTICDNRCDSDWQWVNGPWPWEKEAN